MELITYFNALAVLAVVVLGMGSALFLRLYKKKTFVFLLFFTIFYAYVIKVLDYTLFQFQSLILLKYFMPGIILQGQPNGEYLNLVPLITLTIRDLKTSFLNVLLFVPFGFGLPFITDVRMKRIVIFAALFSIGIEVLQFITGFFSKTTFRIADVNDILFNTFGAAVGYLVCIVFLRMFRRVAVQLGMTRYPIVRYIVDRPQAGMQNPTKDRGVGA